MVNAGVRTPSEDPQVEKPPVFAGSMQPDINFMGFDIPADQVVGGGVGGYYLVIQQHPTEPRFGAPHRSVRRQREIICRSAPARPPASRSTVCNGG